MKLFVIYLLLGVSLLFAKVDINSASVAELTSIKGIGQKTAMKIIEFRENNCFNSIEELQKIKGIKQGKFEKIKEAIEAKPCLENSKK